MRAYWLIALIGLVQASCTYTPDSPSYTKVGARDSISRMESEMKKLENLDTLLAQKMVEAYIQYADSFPQDSMASVFLLKAGNVYKAYPGKANQALKTYRRIVQDYKYASEAPQAVFNSAFIYEDYREADKAAASYRYIIKNYPSHLLAGDAQNLLEMLRSDKGDELQQVQQWMKESKKKQIDNSEE